MELTKNQIQQLHNFIKNKGVIWYDVRLEIVDHFANALEEKLKKKPDFDFTQAVNEIYKDFNDVKFKKLIKEKSKIINTNLRQSAFSHFKGFFKLPKIILSILLFVVLSKAMIIIDNKEMFFTTLHVTLMIMAVISFIKGISYVHNKHQLLAMATVNHFFLAINSFAVIFNSINIFTKKIKFIEFYYFKILIYVLFTLLIITVFYVYNKVRKEIQAQYPEIKITQ